jgi:hypothetical protein
MEGPDESKIKKIDPENFKKEIKITERDKLSYAKIDEKPNNEVRDEDIFCIIFYYYYISLFYYYHLLFFYFF